jgi:hypothetical protein
MIIDDDTPEVEKPKLTPFQRLKSFFGYDDDIRELRKEVKAARRQASIDAGRKGVANKYTPPLPNSVRGYNYRKQRSGDFFTDCESYTPRQARRMRKHDHKEMARG